MAARCPSLYTSNWINRSTIVRARSHFSFLVVENFFASSLFFFFPRSLFLPLAAPPFFCCGRTMSQQRHPLSINRCKQATRPYQPPGLNKSNFFYWPTAKRCSFFVFSITFYFPSITTCLRHRANCRTASPSSGTILFIIYMHRQSKYLKKRGTIYANVCRCVSTEIMSVSLVQFSNNQ